ncbi:uncharacterized protein sS8_1916 [Methylocaldum marinum]|uniref:DUF2157 domain-containing protein n=1 Tax=Methylocaldum marinum TaxID=1432792 RepID=A0A250KQC8_9GAMM|nr:hypothetical protein [Methylocaldum marinum]BBA33870.1 uncharacterized protein sS8_1916 [Methylocaldum marinum]
MYTPDYDEFPARSPAETDQTPAAASLTSRITGYLRWVGSILIILSAISFMLQGHEDLLPAYRYWVGLGLTLLLCGGGLVCARLFKDTKGARIFFGLGAAFVPVQVSQVSAMLYAYWHGQAALQPQYRWLQFMDVSPAVIALDFVITAVLLVVVSYAGYAILARKYLGTLLRATVAGNLLLMLPIRDATLMAIVIAGLFVFLRRTEQRLHRDSSMRLPEGLTARALASLPLWIIIGRSFLHPASYLLAVAIGAIVLVCCIYDIRRYTQSASVIYVCQWLGTFSAVAIWLIVLEQFSTVSVNRLGAMLPVVAILFLLSGQVDFHARLYRLAGSVMAGVVTFGAILDQQPLAPVSAIAAGILLTVAGIRYREKMPFFSGNVCVAGGLLFHIKDAVALYSAAPWISSIGLGLAVILLASLIENKEKLIREKSRYYYNELKNWN